MRLKSRAGGNATFLVERGKLQVGDGVIPASHELSMSQDGGCCARDSPGGRSSVCPRPAVEHGAGRSRAARAWSCSDPAPRICRRQRQGRAWGNRTRTVTMWALVGVSITPANTPSWAANVRGSANTPSNTL